MTTKIEAIERDEIIGGCTIPPELLFPFEITEEIPDDALGRHALKLMSLHPELTNFRNGRLSKMNESTKRQLIADMNRVLGIRQLNRK
jgi:hypothetical protein